MKPDTKQVGEKITVLRNNMGLSLAAFGEILGGVKKGTVDTWCRGLALPKPEVITKLALMSGVSETEFLYGISYEEYINRIESKVHNEFNQINERVNLIH